MESKWGAIIKARQAQASTSQTVLHAREPLRAAGGLRPTRVRGARGDASARARGERSARPGECAGAVRRRRARQSEAVWAGEGGRQEAGGGGGGGAPEPRGRAGLAPREQIGVEETPGSRPEARELGLSTAGLRGRPPRLAPEVAAAPGDSQ